MTANETSQLILSLTSETIAARLVGGAFAMICARRHRADGAVGQQKCNARFGRARRLTPARPAYEIANMGTAEYHDW